ncbi:acyl-CoA dehydrogenase [Streptomyces sp. WAC05374]|uniref:acyl-CoA dehydrogenase family protein n=1 Tax=Streptomyces sp. WAC05374 TaxID=2487420 RepID=UPI000F8940F5|nr:acyl-CoA dehydrogenase family protein [Streptomyces sp. WAC05374]RST09280.1 acyl-CoA dehydrogenase [Streptomyces sp. WAC05374]TDF47814.1 acyl-CoA dehydrogenase [Streptomyces sp. WAC05374]TDF54035.1 acyl-CoA dehydrogenase [Streptomyces sp. WAC05374]
MTDHTPADPELLYSEAEGDLRAAVRSLLADRAAPADLPGRAEDPGAHDAALWKALAADMGTAGLLVPERLGGQGASHREAAVVLEELGRAVTPVPYLTSSVIATETLLALRAGDLLGELATGRVAVLAVPLSAGPGHEPATTGTVTGVADAARADVLLVPRPDGLYAVDAAGATVVPQTPLDLTRPVATVTAGTGGTRLADAGAAREAVRRGLLAGAGLLASEQLGLAEWCLEETVRHTRERHQFNRPVGSFQALKHRMAQLWLEVVNARAAARNAADALATGSPEAPLAVAVAQVYCSRVAVHAAEECVQLHGGIGMTWEHPVHLYLKRAKSDQIALGSAGHHKQTLADLVELPAPA